MGRSAWWAWRSAWWLGRSAGRRQRAAGRSGQGNASGRCRGLQIVADHAADRIAGIGMFLFWRRWRTVGQMIERIELRRRDRFKLEIAFGQRLDALGIVEPSPLGAQRRDLVA